MGWNATRSLLLALVCIAALPVLETRSRSVPDLALEPKFSSRVLDLAPRKSPPNVTITPPTLDFKRRAMCLPSVEEFVVTNSAASGALVIFSCSSDSPSFQPSYFHKQTVSPGQSLSISVLFLAREEGSAIGNLVLETSVGSFLFQVQGEGIRNVYKVKPLINIKVAVGQRVNKHIEIYNPHDEVLSVKEIFTNQAFLHLTLPKGLSPRAKGGGGGSWDVPPTSWSKVMSLSFHGTRGGRHRGFVHVRTNIETLVIPVEVHVMNAGVHHFPDLLDFETLTSKMEKKERKITVLNATPLALAITDLALSNPDPLLQIIFKRGLVLQPHSETVIATVVYSGKTEGQFAGKLVVRTNDTVISNRAMEVGYEAKVLHGQLAYSLINTTFPVTIRQPGSKMNMAGDTDMQAVERSISVTNQFSVAVTLVRAVVHHAAFEVVMFPRDRTLQPREEAPPILVRFKPDQIDENIGPVLPSNNETRLLVSRQEAEQLPDCCRATTMTIHLDVGAVTIPLLVYDGSLSVTGTALRLLSIGAETVDDAGVRGSGPVRWCSMDIGMVGVQDEAILTLNFSNYNPVDVDIQALNVPAVTAKGISIEFLHTIDKSGAVALDEEAEASWSNVLHATGSLSRKSNANAAKVKSSSNMLATGPAAAASIKAGHGVCLQVRVLSKTEERVEETLTFKTDYETLHIRMQYVSREGALKIEPLHLHFPVSFPGKVVTSEVYVTSTYKGPVKITGMRSSDARFRPRITTADATVEPTGLLQHAFNSTLSAVVLRPHERRLIGHVSFDASRGPLHQNYMPPDAWEPLFIYLQEQKVLLRSKNTKDSKDEVELDSQVSASDLQRMEKLLHIWHSISKEVSGTIKIESSMIKPSTITAQATLERPDVLSRGRILIFPLTQVGQTSEQHLSIENPSDFPMMAQLLLPSPTKKRSHACKSAQGCGASSHFLAPRAATVVPPRSWVQLGPIFFLPKASGVHVASAYVRTNLTFLSSVGLRGEGGSGKLELSEGLHGAETCDMVRFDVGIAGSGSPSSHNPLASTQGMGSQGSLATQQYDSRTHQTVSHEAAAAGSKGRRQAGEGSRGALIQMSKVLTLRNSGSLPVEVYSVGLNGDHCEWHGVCGACDWHGLKLHNCRKRLHIGPGSNATIQLSYTAQCNSRHTRAELFAYTSVGTLKRKVLATVAEEELKRCYRQESGAGEGGILRDARHVGLSRLVCLLLLCLGVGILYHRHFCKRLAGITRRPPAGAACVTSKAEHAESKSQSDMRMMLTDGNYAAALLHIQRLRSAHVSEQGAGAVSGQGGRGSGGDSGSGDSGSESSRERKHAPLHRNHTELARRVAATNSSLKEPSISTPKRAGKKGSADNEAQLKGVKGSGVNGLDGLHLVLPDNHDDTWELARAPKAGKAANKDKSLDKGGGQGKMTSSSSSSITDTRSTSSTRVLAIGAHGWGGESGGEARERLGVPVTGSLSGGGLPLFGALDCANGEMWASRSGLGSFLGAEKGCFFGAMPCDPGSSFQTLSHASSSASHLLEASSSLASGAGEMEDFPFPFAPHPASDFPLED